MNFHLKPHPLMAHWAPGFFVLTTILLRHYNWSYHQLMEYMPASQTKSFLVGLTIIVAAWIVGECLDAARDILEHLLDAAWKVEWDFFFWAEPLELEKFEEHYYSYYVFCFNSAIGLTGSILLFVSRGAFAPKVLTGMLILLAFFAADTVLLRREIRRVLADWSHKPHRGNAR